MCVIPRNLVLHLVTRYRNLIYSIVIGLNLALVSFQVPLGLIEGVELTSTKDALTVLCKDARTFK